MSGLGFDAAKNDSMAGAGGANIQKDNHVALGNGHSLAAAEANSGAPPRARWSSEDNSSINGAQDASAAHNAPAKSLQEVKQAKKAALQREFDNICQQGQNLVVKEEFEIMLEALTNAKDVGQVKEFGTLRQHIVRHASYLAKHYLTEQPSSRERLGLLVNFINSDRDYNSPRGDVQTAFQNCADVLKQKFGFWEKNVEKFLKDPNTCHRGALGSLWQELEEIGATPWLVPWGKNDAKREKLQVLLAERQQTRVALRQAGCRDDVITAAMAGWDVEGLEELRAMASDSQCVERVDLEAYSNDCEKILQQRFGFSAKNAVKFIKDSEGLPKYSPAILRQELEDIAAAPGLVPSGALNGPKYRQLQALLAARLKTSTALGSIGCDSQQIAYAIYGVHVAQLNNLRKLAQNPQNKAIVARRIAEGKAYYSAVLKAQRDPAALHEEPCANYLITEFKFSPSKAQRFLSDERSLWRHNPARLLSELKEIAATDGLVSKDPQKLFDSSKYQVLQDALQARQTARQRLAQQNVSHDDINYLLRSYNKVEDLKVLDGQGWQSSARGDSGRQSGNEDSPSDAIAGAGDVPGNIDDDDSVVDASLTRMRTPGGNKQVTARPAGEQTSNGSEGEIGVTGRTTPNKGENPAVHDDDEEDDDLFGDYNTGGAQDGFSPTDGDPSVTGNPNPSTTPGEGEP